MVSILNKTFNIFSINIINNSDILNILFNSNNIFLLNKYKLNLLLSHCSRFFYRHLQPKTAYIFKFFK